MISRCAVYLAEKLYKEDLISAADQDLYTYGFFLLISKVFFFILSILFGVFWNIPLDSILFYVAFSTLRQYAGGYHAPKESICMTATSIVCFTSISAVALAKKFSSETIALSCLLICAIIICYLSPMDTKNKPLSTDEKHHYKIITCYLMIIFIVIAFMATFFHYSGLVHVLSVCSIMGSFLLLLGYHDQAGVIE